MSRYTLCYIPECNGIARRFGLCNRHGQKAKRMGIDPSKLSDRQIDLIADVKARKQVVKTRGETMAVIDVKTEVKGERDMHDKYISFLRRNQLPYIHPSPVTESTIQKGCPDFCVTPGRKYGCRYLYGEFKMPGKKLSPAQVDYHAFLKEAGCEVRIWYSYEQALRETAEYFGLALHHG
jgi:hypothetical protein